MAKQKYTSVYSVFVSSPGDMGQERQLLDEVVDRINREERDRGVELQLWKWESDASRRLGAGPQGEIDKQLPKYDVYLGILGGRFGTPTAQCGSGTEQEFRDALERKNRGEDVEILFFFKTDLPAPTSMEDLEQFGQVLAFKNEINKLGLFYEYKEVRGSKESFYELAETHLRRLVRIAAKKAAVEAKPAPVEPAPVEPARGPGPGPGPAGPDSELTDEVSAQFGYFEPNTALDERDKVIERTRRSLFDLIVPAYMLDTTFHFLDWNTAFDEIIAKPLRLNRQKHAIEFIQGLVNCEEVVGRSKSLFGYAKENPIVDIEPLVFQSPEFGRIEFQKIAAQTIDRRGNPLAWSVTLNIGRAEQEEALWHRLEDRLKDQFNWTRYAVSYDQLLMPFDNYNNLLDRAVELIGDARLCVDLGAGSGNGTLRLLESDKHRVVWAVESNDAMLQYLRAKVHDLSEKDESILNRLTTVKGNVERLDCATQQQGYFDAALMINVLYSVEDPVACLKQTCELLKPAGVLVISCAHRDTDVPKLFRELRRNLTSQKLFHKLKDAYEEAKRAHHRMDHLIHRDTLDELRAMIDEAGFDIVHEEPAYVDSVMLIKAEKREEFW